MASRRTALLQLAQPAAATLSLARRSFLYNGAPTQRLTIAVNGHPARQLRMQNGWSGLIVWMSPAAFLSQGK